MNPAHPGETAVTGTTSEQEGEYHSKSVEKKHGVTVGRETQRAINTLASFFFFPVNSINVIWCNLREQLN